MPWSSRATTTRSTARRSRSALAAGTTYVGAMGSRRTQARRREWLLANGVSEQALGALHAPIGLDIGADEPGEIAVSILAEIVAVRRGAGSSVSSIGDRDGAIHPDLGARGGVLPRRLRDRRPDYQNTATQTFAIVRPSRA